MTRPARHPADARADDRAGRGAGGRADASGLTAARAPGMMAGVNAVERFLAASRSGDLAAAAAELAPDVVLLNPTSDEPFVGRPAVATTLAAVAAACDEFRHTHLLAATAAADGRLFGLVFEARIGEQALRGVDLVELDEQDRIARVTVLARPVGALVALGARMAAGP